MTRHCRFVAAATFAALVLVASACTRGPGEAALRAEVEDKLNTSFKGGLFEVEGLKRQGSAPLQASETGAARRVVYYNLSLGLRDSYNFGDWEGLTAASLAQVLGATEKGITGIGSGKMAFLRAEAGEGIEVMGALKRALDPENRMNPGKVVDV